MKPIALLSRAALVLATGLTLAASESPLSLSAALESHRLTAEASGNGRDQLTLTLQNVSSTALAVAVPAGLIAAGSNTGDRVIVLRAADASVPAHAVVDVALPTAALALKATAGNQPFKLTHDAEPRLAPLLKYLATQPDLPRATAQLAVFCLLENVTFAQWLAFLASTAVEATATESHPTPAEVTEAIDVLGILREIAPDQTFALKTDGDLKLRALRNPWSRAKAMQIYGLQIGDGALPPDIGQLLHTQSGDNCPVCRQRTRMQQPLGDP